MNKVRGISAFLIRKESNDGVASMPLPYPIHYSPPTQFNLYPIIIFNPYQFIPMPERHALPHYKLKYIDIESSAWFVKGEIGSSAPLK